MKSNIPIVLKSQEPINDGGRKYNYIYIICAIIFFIAFLCMGSNFLGLIFSIFLGLCVGWLIKNKILDIISTPLRTLEFELQNKLPYSELIAKLIPILTPLGMMIEKSSDERGIPIITYQGIIYDITYDTTRNVFTIWWRKNIARAFLTVDSIGTYRKIVVAMGIIGYNIQQICKLPSGEELCTDNMATLETNVDKHNQGKRFCTNCGKEIVGKANFCVGCGQAIK